MKKMKGVLDLASSRAKFQHQSFIHDYQDLQQETEVIKENLETLRQKKLTLSAEVRFLRRRYNYLMENQSANLQSKQSPVQVQPKNLIIQSKNVTKRKNNKARDDALQCPVPKFNSNHKGRTNTGKKSTLRKKDGTSKRKETALHNSAPTLNLNQNLTGSIETDHARKETTMQKMTPVFDLNQISREEEEFQVYGEPSRFEEVKKYATRTTNDEQHNDVKLSICRNTGNGSNRAGKRKISWQDQVALKA